MSKGDCEWAEASHFGTARLQARTAASATLQAKPGFASKLAQPATGPGGPRSQSPLFFEAPVEQTLRLFGARFLARHAVDHEDQALAVALSRGGHAVAAGRGLPGLDAVGAGVAAEQRVAVGVGLAAESELALGEHAVALGIALQDHAGELRDIGRRHVVAFGRMPGGV